MLAVERESGKKVNNIVFMGMGEPLANLPNLLHAIGIINAPWGIGIGARHMTVSTSGLAPQIRSLADQPLQIRLGDFEFRIVGATFNLRKIGSRQGGQRKSAAARPYRRPVTGHLYGYLSLLRQ